MVALLTLLFRATAGEAESLDASEGLGIVLDHADELDLPTSLLDLLMALDDAITEALERKSDGVVRPDERR